MLPRVIHEQTSSRKTDDSSGSAQYIEGLERLIAVTRELSLCRSLRSIQSVAKSAARSLTGADGATFVLRDGDFCHYVDEDAIAPLWKGNKFPLDTCVSGWSMKHHQSVVIEDIYKDPRIPADAYRPTFVKSLAMVPIRTEAPIGAIGNYWARHYRPTAGEVMLLQSLADATAIAMENVSAFNDLEIKLTRRSEELDAANQEIRRLSLYDDLTGLYNRFGFYLLAEQALTQARRQKSVPNVIYIDIDGLKRVNDMLGHEAGDRLITTAARLIKSTMRKADIVGRIGDDEFCILAANCSCEAPGLRLTEAVDRFNASGDFSFKPFTLHLNIGAAPPAHDEETLDALITRARTAAVKQD